MSLGLQKGASLCLPILHYHREPLTLLHGVPRRKGRVSSREPTYASLCHTPTGNHGLYCIKYPEGRWNPIREPGSPAGSLPMPPYLTLPQETRDCTAWCTQKEGGCPSLEPPYVHFVLYHKLHRQTRQTSTQTDTFIPPNATVGHGRVYIPLFTWYDLETGREYDFVKYVLIYSNFCSV